MSTGSRFAVVLVALLAGPGWGTAQDGPSPGRIRTYFIAAEEVMWDYLPHGVDLAGVPVSGEVEGGRQTVFRKAVYREYTDETFQTPKPRAPEWEHLGILGPLIRAEVGDTIRVHFWNNTKIFASMHPHGLAYDKNSEGATYLDGTPAEQKRGAAVPPGERVIYTWTVPERAGPAHADTSSILWAYHSHFVETREMNTGLIGPIIVTRRGAAHPDGKPTDVDREFVVLFGLFDETSSMYFEANTMAERAYTPLMRVADPAFREMYLFDSLNGLIKGNLPRLTMGKGERVRWYLMANGNLDDIHTPHWHGQTVLFMHMRMDMVPLMPMMMITADMVPDTAGTWLFHCHVNDHLEGGMVGLYTVTE